ncbi:hypothetical protein B4N89_27890 [Embleya scabrispora]|uniref:Head-tail adaptor protein n=1 Tax=Embleya scabrispora TaxID=159449 RepID=A0A1T3P5K6_9ACTN|nr:hypothetical protein [Embleya scabrispora]OPC84241.1 hypothetical protein B4N89_27890 [Embleya scabrispora]
MVFPVPFGVTLIRLRSGPSPGRDPYGKPIPGPVVETPLPGCVVTPRQAAPAPGGSEQQARDTVIKGLTVYAPPGTDVRTTDRFRHRGLVYEVTGEPGEWGPSAFTGTAGCTQFLLDRITG